MATYKVIQDIEAEDKLIGPLSLRQFIYAAFVAIMGFIAFKLAAISVLFVIPFIPPMIFFGLLAAPFGQDQSTEIWLLAKIRFFLKPRRRIWDQSGLKELVTVSAPKKIDRILTKGLSQDEVRSRLNALANTIDSRGWAVKNVNVNLFSQPSYVLDQMDSDRLIDPRSIPQEVPNFDAGAESDIMDEQNNPTAHHIDEMVTASAQAHRQQLVAQMQRTSAPAATNDPPADYWFMNQPDPSTAPPGYAVFDDTQTVSPGAQTQAPSTFSGPPTTDEQALLNRIHAESDKPEPANTHLKTIQPLGRQRSRKRGTLKPSPTPATTPSQTQATSTPDPAIIDLARNDDLNVATLARQANKAHQKQPPKDEVIISLR